MHPIVINNRLHQTFVDRAERLWQTRLFVSSECSMATVGCGASWPTCSASCAGRRPARYVTSPIGVAGQPQWKDVTCALGVPFDLVHRNERSADVARLTGDLTPAVLAQTNDGHQMLMGPNDFAGVSGDAVTSFKRCVGPASTATCRGRGLRPRVRQGGTVTATLPPGRGCPLCAERAVSEVSGMVPAGDAPQVRRRVLVAGASVR